VKLRKTVKQHQSKTKICNKKTEIKTN